MPLRGTCEKSKREDQGKGYEQSGPQRAPSAAADHPHTNTKAYRGKGALRSYKTIGHKTGMGQPTQQKT